MMTIDELLKWLIDKSKDEEGNVTSHKYAYNTVWDFIETNRPALEAGMQKPLRFRIEDIGDELCRSNWGCDLLAKDGTDFEKYNAKYATRRIYQPIHGSYSCKETALKHARWFAELLGLPVEFEVKDSG